ncbi:GMC oxidoreductase [Mycobacterium stomatepiae]|uniref:GMC oxidoreductase n=1 Tax=Mycobacterium stomatepiae TaxID=470076 RepID=UPI0018D72E7E|nr:GMC oxidoreductase [Mycobacterium stomatepiae]
MRSADSYPPLATASQTSNSSGTNIIRRAASARRCKRRRNPRSWPPGCHADPLKPPRIDPAYFSDPADIHETIAGLSAAIEIAQQPSLRKFFKGMNLPTEVNLDQAALAAHARNWSQTEYHAVGTCAMGVDERAVVDPELKVRGVEGLRVVDASVMPAIISGNTNAATVMIAEKGADLIKNSRCPRADTRR